MYGKGQCRKEKLRRVKEWSVTITCNLAVPAPHHRISAIPRIQILVSKSFLFKNHTQRVYVFAYCHIAYISPGSCKDCVKEPPPPLHFTQILSPVHYTFALLEWSQISFFIQFLFQSKFHKEVVVFWRQMLANSIYKGTSPHSKRIDNAELF